jgi:putative aminopeptidase FrvX
MNGCDSWDHQRDEALNTGFGLARYLDDTCGVFLIVDCGASLMDHQIPEKQPIFVSVQQEFRVRMSARGGVVVTAR